MGFFRDLMKKKPATAEEVSSKIAETTLEPITINLNSQQFQCNSHGHWCPVAQSEQPAGRMQEEVLRLRKEKVALEREILRYARQEQEMKQLKEKLNLMDLKYKVLVEMWATNKANGGANGGEENAAMEDVDADLCARKGSKFIWPKERYHAS